MKIFNVDQIRKADQYTIEHEPITSIDLTERASYRFVDWFEKNFDKSKPVIVFCGTGNNGGDGMAVARMMRFKKWKVEAAAINLSGSQSPDFNVNFLKFSQNNPVRNIESKDDLDFSIGKNTIIIDAVFGSGLNRKVHGIYADVIEMINNSGALIVSIDVPSGLFTDRYTPEGSVIKADYVLTFQFPKLAFLLSENYKYAGNWQIADIGLHEKFISQTETDYYYLEKPIIKNLIRERTKYEHKGNFGKSLIIAGSHGKMGAAVLCAKACLRAGAGLVTAHIPSCGYQILQSSVPEVMVTTDFNKKFLTEIPDVSSFDAVGIGPGIDKNLETYEVLAQLFQSYKKPIVADADALNIIAKEQNLMRMIPPGSILTPHPGEFRRMVGFWNDDFERLEQQIAVSKEYNVYVVLKGGHSTISTPEGKVYFNSTGNPGMATGGSGDVLTGMITSLLGQGYSSLHAALIGVYLHGLSGDIAVRFTGEESLIAGDLIDYLSEAFAEVKS